MNYSIIVAVSENNVIGKDNRLLWHLSGDMKRFKAITTGHTIVMGRKTFLSLGRALPNRRNVVLSSSMRTGAVENVEVYSSLLELQQALSDEEEVIIIGGGELYRQFLPLATKVYLTLVHTQLDGDVTFPELDEKEWLAISKESFWSDEKNDYDYDFINYVRR